MNDNQSPIVATNLVRHFGDVKAVDGVDLEVRPGEIFGFLGPNGAGKSTVIRMLTTLLKPTSGTATVAGFDIVTQANDVRRNIGVALQDAAIDPLMTGNELLHLQAVLYGLPAKLVASRADELLERVGLVGAADRRVGTYSGGMRRRLDLALSLIHQPTVLFLDEPTTGLDPMSRITLWEEVRRLNDEGTTVLLTTQYLEEADQLADRVAIIDHGKIVKEGTPTALKAAVGAPTLLIAVAGKPRADGARHARPIRRAADDCRGQPRRRTGRRGGGGHRRRACARRRRRQGDTSRAERTEPRRCVRRDDRLPARGRIVGDDRRRRPGTDRQERSWQMTAAVYSGPVNPAAPVQARGLWWSQTVAMSKRSIIAIYRQPALVIPSLIFPLFFAALGTSSFGRADRAAELPQGRQLPRLRHRRHHHPRRAVRQRHRRRRAGHRHRERLLRPAARHTHVAGQHPVGPACRRRDVRRVPSVVLRADPRPVRRADLSRACQG